MCLFHKLLFFPAVLTRVWWNSSLHIHIIMHTMHLYIIFFLRIFCRRLSGSHRRLFASDGRHWKRMADFVTSLRSDTGGDFVRRPVRDPDAHYRANVLLLPVRRPLRGQISAVWQALRSVSTTFLRCNTSRHHRAHFVSHRLMLAE